MKCFIIFLATSPVIFGLIRDPISFSVHEECKIGTVIGNLKSKCPLPDGSIFKMVDPYVSQRLLQINELTGEIKTASRINRESICQSKSASCEYSFNVEVKRGDTHETEIFAVRLTINDINDERPKFEAKNRPLILQILESTQIGSRLSLPLAEDKDSTGFDQIIYRLQPKEDAGDFFKLVSEKKRNLQFPKLELIRNLDRETKSVYHMVLYAMDSGYLNEKDSIAITIKVLDSNDNKPEWEMSRSSIVVSECDRLHRNLIELRATDKDEDTRIHFYIGRTATNMVSESFYVSGKFLKQNKSLDYEVIKDEPLYVPLVAEDSGGLKSETELEVRVTDCNDYYPNITIDAIDLNIVENDDKEKKLARLMILDEDKGENATVECRILQPYRKYFQLGQYISDGKHQTWYTLTKNQHAKFDREITQQGEITIFVECSDKGPEPKKAQKSIVVKIIDENDNHPRFDRTSYHFRIAENQNDVTFIGVVRATDKDSHDNSKIDFDIDPDGRKYFSIKPIDLVSAAIYSISAFDRETRSLYKFTVTATDRGDKVKLTSSVSVTVEIQDVNDCPPTFKHNEYNFRVVEDYGKNSSKKFIGEVHASDEDLGENKVILYEINQRTHRYAGSPRTPARIQFYFEQNRLYGRGNFDREELAVIHLEIIARNSKLVSSAYSTGTAQVSITLLDLNDCRPKIERLMPAYNISEDSAVGSQVLTVQGHDADDGENGTIAYSLQGTDYGFFNIEPTLGIVTLIKSLKGVFQKTFRLNIKAKDKGHNPLSSEYVTTHISVVTYGNAGSSNTGHSYPKANGKAYQPNNDHSLLILLCLAAVVFLILVILIGVLVYVHLKGRREAGGMVAENPVDWIDKTNMDLAEDPTDIGTGFYRFPDILKTGEDRGAYKTGTLVIDNTHNRNAARSPNGTLLKTKSPSYGYIPIASNDRKLYSKHSSSLRRGDGEKYESYFSRNSEKLPRRIIAYNAGAQSSDNLEEAPTPVFQSKDSSIEKIPTKLMDDGREYHNLRGRVEENRPVTDAHGYAMLTETAAPTSESSQHHHSQTKTPYVTSSFV